MKIIQFLLHSIFPFYFLLEYYNFFFSFFNQFSTSTDNISIRAFHCLEAKNIVIALHSITPILVFVTSSSIQTLWINYICGVSMSFLNDLLSKAIYAFRYDLLRRTLCVADQLHVIRLTWLIALWRDLYFLCSVAVVSLYVTWRQKVAIRSFLYLDILITFVLWFFFLLILRLLFR